MGIIVESKCTNCGFNKRLAFGGGRHNHNVNNPVPALDEQTGSLESPNYYEHKDNPRYSFYTDSKLKSNTEKDQNLNWGNLYLSPTNNYCPSCQTYNLMFWSNIFTD
ncbi:MAG: hypothetical protein IR153_06410 [Flavobacterium sp.]|nr:hypothetical protein [Flavobacterium sp.]